MRPKLPSLRSLVSLWALPRSLARQAMDRVNIFIPLRDTDVKQIRAILRRRRFEFARRDHAHFTAKKDRLHVTVYEKGPKELVQGNEAAEFARSVLEPLVARE